MKKYENVDEALCKEMEKLDKKYTGEVEMSHQDLETIRMLYSAMLKAETLYAMREEAEWDDEEGVSGRERGYRRDRSYDGMEGEGRSFRRGRDGRGRYVSREMDPASGHYPEWMPPYYGGRY